MLSAQKYERCQKNVSYILKVITKYVFHYIPLQTTTLFFQKLQYLGLKRGGGLQYFHLEHFIINNILISVMMSRAGWGGEGEVWKKYCAHSLARLDFAHFSDTSVLCNS